MTICAQEGRSTWRNIFKFSCLDQSDWREPKPLPPPPPRVRWSFFRVHPPPTLCDGNPYSGLILIPGCNLHVSGLGWLTGLSVVIVNLTRHALCTSARNTVLVTHANDSHPSASEQHLPCQFWPPATVPGFDLESGAREETERCITVKDMTRAGIKRRSHELAPCALHVTARSSQHDTTDPGHRAFDVIQCFWGSNSLCWLVLNSMSWFLYSSLCYRVIFVEKEF